MLDFVWQVDKEFPYKKAVIWSIEYGAVKEYRMHVMNSENARHHRPKR